MTRAACWALGALVFAGAGCDSCRRDPPRILLPDAGAASGNPVDDASIEMTDAGPAVDAQAVLSGTALGDGSTFELDGVTVRPPAGTRFAQLLALDPDGDGDRDLVATTTRADGTVAGVVFYRRAPAGLAAVAIAGVALPTDTAVPMAVQLRSTSPRTVVVVYRATPASAPDGGAPGAAQTLLEEHVVISLVGAAPSVRTRVALLAPSLPDTVLDAAVTTVDRDGDGRDDVIVSVGARRPEDRVERAARAELVWLDRPAGLARDTREPEASFARLGSQLRAMATRRRAQDLPAAAGRVVRLRRALCSDAGAPRVRVGGELGVACANSPGLRAAADALARGYVVLGEYPAAIALTRPETASELGAVEPSRIATDLRRPAVTDARVVYRAGPAIAQSLDAARFARLPALVLTPSTVTLRGPVTATIDLATLAATAGPPGTLDDVAARSPDGALELEGFYETCDGEVAGFCPVPDAACVASALGLGATGRLALPVHGVLARITDLPSPERGAACLREGTSAAPVSRAVDVRAMGFGRDGLVVEWHGRLLRATPGGANVATAVGPGEPLGSAFAPGSSISASGQYAVVATTEGVFVRDGAGHWRAWAPSELAGRYRQLTDLTIGNDGQTAVGLLAGQLVVLTHAGAIPSAPPVAAGAPDAATPAP